MLLYETTTTKQPQDKPLNEAEIRRQMYERMARGSAVETAEDHARETWKGKRKGRWH